MNDHKFISKLLFILIAVYFSQGVFYSQGAIISQLVLLGILGISLVYFVKSFFLKRSKPLLFKVWTLLLISNLLLYLFTADFSNPLHFSKLKGLLIITLPFYSFYYLSYLRVINKKYFVWMFVIILPVAIIQFYNQRAQVLLERNWTDNVVNNMAYFFVFLIPFLFFFKKKILSVMGALILMFFIIQGSKRGAILIGGIGLIFFAYYQLKNIDKKHRYRSYLFSMVALIALGYFTLDFYNQNEYLVTRIQTLSEGSYSGRDYIYANIFNAWFTSNDLMNLLFGFGFGASLLLSKTGNWAHNDWLEGLAGLGLVGVIMYALLIYSAFILVYKNKWAFDKKMLLYAVMSIWFLSTLFSMNYYNATYSFFQYIILAYLAGSTENSIK